MGKFTVFLLATLFCFSSHLLAEIIYTRPSPLKFKNLDTLKPASEIVAFVFNQVFDTLFRVNKKGELQPVLVSEWNFKDSKVLNITLKKNVRFHDGSELGARDVKYTLSRLANSKHFLSKKLKNIQRIDVLDKYRLKIVLNNVEYAFLKHLTHSPTSILKEKQSSSDLNGTGPFKLDKKDEFKVSLVKYSLYHDKKSTIDKLNIVYLERKDAIENFRKNKVDDLFHYLLDKNEYKELKNRCAWKFELLPTFRFVVLKSNNKLLKSTKNRSCILNAIDRKSYMNRTASGVKFMKKVLPLGVYGDHLLTSLRSYKCDNKTEAEVAKLSKKFPLMVPTIKTIEHLVDPLVESFKRKNINVKKIYFKNIEEYLQSFKSSKVDFYVARFTPTSPQVNSYALAFGGKNPFFPTLSPDKSYMNKGIFDSSHKSDELVRTAQMFTKLNTESLYLPLYQFEFYGCYSKKWKNIKIPITGYINQRLNEIETD